MLNISLPPCTGVPDCAKKHNPPPKKLTWRTFTSPAFTTRRAQQVPGNGGIPVQ